MVLRAQSSGLPKGVWRDDCLESAIEVRCTERVLRFYVRHLARAGLALLDAFPSGISQSTWGDACHVMGRNEAALALMVIDRNRSHPIHPVKNPGGAFRAMIERTEKESLN